MSPTRRQLVGRGLALAGAAAVPGTLLVATPARAQAEAETGALERLVGLEQAGALAYEEAAGEEGALSGKAKALAAGYARHAGERASALEAAIEQLGAEAPEAPDDVAAVELLEGFEGATEEPDLVDFLVRLEEETLAAYLDAAPELEAEDIVRAGAQIAASHAQQLVALRLLAGERPSQAVRIPSVPTDGGAADEAESGARADE